MPFYSQELIDEILEKTDIVDLIGQYVHLKKRGSSYVGLCPFHNEKTPSFTVSPDKQLYYCFGCHATGNAYGFLMKYEQMQFPEAVETLGRRAGVSLPERSMTAQERAESSLKAQLFEINKEAATYYYKLLRSRHGEHAYEYFTKRQLTPETMQKFGLGYSDQYSDDLYKYLKGKGYKDDVLKESGLITLDEKHGGRDKFWNRAMFPIMNIQNRVIAFGGRVMGDGEPKYLNSPETRIFNKSKNLYGLNLAKQSRRGYFILCEGYMDVIALHQAGFNNAVASLGTSLTSGHVALLRKHTSKVYLSYDSDPPGINAALRAIPMLRSQGIEVKIIHMDPYKDPDEFMKGDGPEGYEERIQNAENSFVFEIRMLQKNYDMTDPTEKFNFYNAVADRLLGFNTSAERNSYLDTVCVEFNIPKEDLTQLISRKAAGGGLAAASRADTDTFEGRQNQGPQYRSVYGRTPRQKTPDGNVESIQAEAEKLILSWLTEYPELYGKIKDFISVDDFDEGIMRETAQETFSQIEQSGRAEPAKIISKFQDEEEQEYASGIFQADAKDFADTQPEILDSALKQSLIRVKRAYFSRMQQEMDVNDIRQFTLVSDQKEMEKKISEQKFF